MTTSQSHTRTLIAIALAASVAGAQSIAAQCPAMTTAALPLTYAGLPTVAEISACDLMTRLYAFANDSMGGRRVGTADHERATNYIAAEAKRLGLKPAGDNGTYFQLLPLVARALDMTSTIVVDAVTLKAGEDFVATTSAAQAADFKDLKIVYGGTFLDTTTKLFTIPPSGTIVVFAPAVQGLDQPTIQRTAKGHEWVTWYVAFRNRGSAAAQINPNALRAATNPNNTLMLVDHGAPITLTVTTAALQKMFGGSLDGVAAGTSSKPLTLNLKFVDTPKISRNVIAIVPGTDAKLKDEYVALGAHSDHIGLARGPADHDSVRATHMGSRAGTEGAASRKQTTEDEEYDRIRFLKDSLHKARPVRLDSINNGADDGGSGTVALLEIAESLTKGALKPKRSVLFVWHSGAEGTPALSGSNWLVDHPTVARDSIVAEFDVDMIGRGEKTDEVGITADDIPRYGNVDFLEVIGAKRQSSELGALIEQSNVSAKTALKLDYTADAEGHPEGLFCRNDASAYGRLGIPAALFTTGYHSDYRQVTDEPQYVQYQHMARITRLVGASTLKIANLDHRLTADKPKPDPKAICKP
ncbi:MAG: M28 family peptidase [Gemmatimonadaceae bacterium]